MSYEDLEQHDLFLPREHWGEVDLNSSTSPWGVLLAGAWAVVSVILMVAGAGGPITWLGGGLFILFLYGYAIMSSRAIDSQNRVIRDLNDRQQTPSGPER